MLITIGGAKNILLRRSPFQYSRTYRFKKEKIPTNDYFFHLVAPPSSGSFGTVQAKGLRKGRCSMTALRPQLSTCIKPTVNTMKFYCA